MSRPVSDLGPTPSHLRLSSVVLHPTPVPPLPPLPLTSTQTEECYQVTPTIPNRVKSLLFDSESFQLLHEFECNDHCLDQEFSPDRLVSRTRELVMCVCMWVEYVLGRFTMTSIQVLLMFVI